MKKKRKMKKTNLTKLYSELTEIIESQSKLIKDLTLKTTEQAQMIDELLSEK